MTVAEFIRWLNTQDMGATVEIMVGHRATGYGGDSYSRRDFNPDEHADYSDLRGNPHIKPDAPYFNKRTLFLGGED